MNWELIAVLASAATVWWQLQESRKDASRRAVLEVAQGLDTAGRRILPFSIRESQRDVLAFYRGETIELGKGGAEYISYLSHLETIALALEQRLIDRRALRDFLVAAAAPHMVTSSFIALIQEECGPGDQTWSKLKAEIERRWIDPKGGDVYE